ncbi:hypothetical protein BC831DRAFT_277077 [Entophlyctis helioformis]|nr:hypothetical protein BC831DRAFT_277077 [Entophlyctis helioformis]
MIKIEQKKAAAAAAAAAASAAASSNSSTHGFHDSITELSSVHKHLNEFAEEDEDCMGDENDDVPVSVGPQGLSAKHPKRKWRLVYIAILSGQIVKHVFKDIVNECMNLQYAPQGQNNDTMLFMLKNHHAKADASLTAKVVELLRGERLEKDIETLERLLTIRVKAMQRFSMDQRLKFCKIMQYESFPANSLIVKEGHVSKAFYFMLSGQVEIFKLKDGLKYRLNALNAGESFGDRTMNLLNDKRTASVATTVESEFLKIDKSDFFDITNVRDEKSIANRIAEVSRIPLFASTRFGFVEKMTSFCQFVTYEPNETIVLEGSSNIRVYWVLKGVCKCFKVVPFHRKRLGTTYEAGDKTMLVPYDPASHAGGQVKEEDIVKQLLAIQELEFGSYFPDFPPPPVPSGADAAGGVGSSLYNPTFDKAAYIKLLETEDPTNPRTKAAASVVATTKVEVLCMNRAELAKIASESMLQELIAQDHVFNVTLAQLQEAYLGKLNWDNYRKKVSDEVTSRRGAKK